MRQGPKFATYTDERPTSATAVLRSNGGGRGRAPPCQPDHAHSLGTVILCAPERIAARDSSRYCRRSLPNSRKGMPSPRRTHPRDASTPPGRRAAPGRVLVGMLLQFRHVDEETVVSFADTCPRHSECRKPGAGGRKAPKFEQSNRLTAAFCGHDLPEIGRRRLRNGYAAAGSRSSCSPPWFRH